MKSDIAKERMRALMDEIDAIAIKSDTVRSREELELAYHLAKKSFKNKKNIARSLRYEFLLWLTGKNDIKSAMEMSAPKEGEFLTNAGREDFLLVVFADERKMSDNEIAGMFEAEILPFGLNKRLLTHLLISPYTNLAICRPTSTAPD